SRPLRCGRLSASRCYVYDPASDRSLRPPVPKKRETRAWKGLRGKPRQRRNGKVRRALAIPQSQPPHGTGIDDVTTFRYFRTPGPRSSVLPIRRERYDGRMFRWALLAMGLPLAAQQISIPPAVPYIRVHGEATVSAQPDRMQMDVGVISQGPTSQAAADL